MDPFVEMLTKKFSVVILNDMSAKKHTLHANLFLFFSYYISETPNKKQVHSIRIICRGFKA